MVETIYIILGFWLIIFIFGWNEVRAIQERDPAARNPLEVVLLYSGLHAIVFHRIAHVLWKMRIPLLPRFISQIVRFVTGIEIHPGAQLGTGILIDHGMGVVIGETAVIGNNVTMYQGVTLGGTGKETGKRHPTLGSNIVVGAGAKILGNITIGDNSYIGANAVVLASVPPNATVVGVPGHVTKQDGEKIDKKLAHAQILDPVMQDIDELAGRIDALEKCHKENK
ncbi:MAG: serine O-acetyltransferase [Candidatus Omnitrophica bacterium]|nr:serine O-acetyltransferase [Candidatus Omnitrophota bacterium]